jgi:hypothetical protein
MLLATLIAAPLATLPPNFQRDCELLMMHNARGIYVPESRARRLCTCSANKLSRWVATYGATAIPFEVEKGAAVSCMREEGRSNV